MADEGGPSPRTEVLEPRRTSPENRRNMDDEGGPSNATEEPRCTSPGMADERGPSTATVEPRRRTTRKFRNLANVAQGSPNTEETRRFLRDPPYPNLNIVNAVQGSSSSATEGSSSENRNMADGGAGPSNATQATRSASRTIVEVRMHTVTASYRNSIADPLWSRLEELEGTLKLNSQK